MPSQDDLPIVACSTGLKENSALAVIRICGFSSIDHFKPFFKSYKKFRHRYACYCKFSYNEIFLDDVIVTYFEGPNSFNGENILEISVHGNQFNINRILSTLIDSKLFRLARNGEFTLRALENKKLNLSQVEGLDLLLNASSSMMYEQGLSLLNGDLYLSYNNLYQSFLELKIAIELNIDFLEDIGEKEGNRRLQSSLINLKSNIDSLYSSAKVDSKNFLSPDIAIIGLPNSGKSTLFNKMLKTKRAIVSDIKGTTRDYLTEYININTNSFRIIDTAGIRETDDLIEKEGIESSLEFIEKSFFKILLINSMEDFCENSLDLSIDKFNLIIFTHFSPQKIDSFKHANLIETLDSSNICYLFADLLNLGSNARIGSIEPISNTAPIGPENKSGSIEPINKTAPIGPENKNGPIEPINKIAPIGPKNKSGSIEPEYFFNIDISDKVSAIVGDNYEEILKTRPICLERHKLKILEINNFFEEFYNNINNLYDIAIISSEAQILELKIQELVGIVTPKELLNTIFSNFCIGK